MIGAGILRTPADVASALPVPALFLSAWLIGGIYALLGANALAELGTMLPQSGGQYVFVRHALGPFAGFLVGWNDWISSCGSVAAIALVEGEAIGGLFPSLSRQAVVIAAVLLAVVTLILWRGVRESDRTQRVTSVLKTLVLLALVAACFVARAVGVTVPGAVAAPGAIPAGAALVGAFFAALPGVIYSYDGWTGVIYFSEEVQNGARNIPRALLLGVLSVIGLYLLLNLAFLAVLPVHVIARSPMVATSAATAVFGPRGGMLVDLIIAIALPSAVVANLLLASRVSFALARDGVAPRVLASVNAGGTPATALLASSVVTALFLLTGAFARIIAICAFMFVAAYAMSFASVFVLRWREPHAPRPYRAWGHPWTTALVLAGSLAFLGGVVAADPRTGVLALGLVAISYPAYRLLASGQRAA